jgi:hypothetical protein
MTRTNVVWARVATLGFAAAPAFAQGGGASSTGSISGVVSDAQGGVLPGVTVTATSPAQIGQLTAVTNDAGVYRFPSVPPGEYRLSYELAGFQTVIRNGVRSVTLNRVDVGGSTMGTQTTYFSYGYPGKGGRSAGRIIRKTR